MGSQRLADFFKDDSGYNNTHLVPTQVPALDAKGEQVIENGKIKTEAQTVSKYIHGHTYLLVSGLGLSLFALFALEMKEALWRPANPILNHTLSYISPFRAVMGRSWVADGINQIVSGIRTRHG